jgi:predicted kinase
MTSGSAAALAVLIGAAGSGKTAAAAQGWEPGQVLSLDAVRGQVSGDPCDQAATSDAVAVLQQLLRARLRRWLPTVVDATNAGPSDRAPLLAAARDHQMPAVAVVMATPLAACLARNAARPGPPPGARWGPRVPDPVVRRQFAQIEAGLPGLRAEGFTQVHLWSPRL